MDSRTPELDALYRDVLLDHYRSPRGRSPVAEPTVVNEGQNPLCGDAVRVALKLDHDHVDGICVDGHGCSISVASGSMMAELLKGRTTADAERLIGIVKDLMHGKPLPDHLETGDLDSLQGVQKFPVRVKCALLPWMTLEDALHAHAGGRQTPGAPTTTDTGGELS